MKKLFQCMNPFRKPTELELLNEQLAEAKLERARAASALERAALTHKLYKQRCARLQHEILTGVFR